MNSILQFMQSDLLARLGMTLIHSLWQLLLLAVLFRIFLFTVGNQAAKPRYWGAILFLFAAMVIPATTFLVSPGRLADVHQHPLQTIESQNSQVVELDNGINLPALQPQFDSSKTGALPVGVTDEEDAQRAHSFWAAALAKTNSLAVSCSRY